MSPTVRDTSKLNPDSVEGQSSWRHVAEAEEQQVLKLHLAQLRQIITYLRLVARVPVVHRKMSLTFAVYR